MKKLICIILAFVMLIGLVPFSCAYAETKNGFDEFDFMVLLDRSTSMSTTDPEDVATEAAKMFIDACEISDSRVSIARFSLDCEVSRFFTLNTISNRDAAKKEIDKARKSTGSIVGSALLESVNFLLENGAPDRKKFIVLLSDGGVNEDDVSKLQEASDICKENSIPVYVIGAQNSSWDISDETRLSELAEQTNGDFLLATSIQEVPDFFRSIFGKLRNTTIIDGPIWKGDGNYHVVPVEVKDTFMSYADVNVSSGGKLEDVYIEDPNGNRVEFDDVHFIRSASRLYNYIRLVEPDKGTWKVYIKGATNDEIHVSYIVNYAVEVVPFVTKEHMTATDYGKIGAKLILRGSKPANRDFYEFMSTACAIVKWDGGSETVPLSYDESEGCLTAEYVPTGVGKHTVDAYVMCEYFQRQNSEDKSAVFTAGNSAPVVIGDVEPIRLDIADENNMIATLYYERLFKDPNGDPMTFTVKGDKRKLDISEHSDSFDVTADSPCEGNVIVTATDSAGASADYTFPVSVIDSSLVQKRIITASIIAAALLLIVAAILCTRRVRGKLTVSMEGAAPKGSVSFSLESMRRKLTLKEIIKHAEMRYLNEYCFEVSSGFDEMVSENADVLNRITVSGTVIAFPKKLTLRSKGDCSKIRINGRPAGSGKLTVTDGQYVNITVEGYDRYVISLNYSTSPKSSTGNTDF